MLLLVFMVPMVMLLPQPLTLFAMDGGAGGVGSGLVLKRALAKDEVETDEPPLVVVVPMRGKLFNPSNMLKVDRDSEDVRLGRDGLKDDEEEDVVDTGAAEGVGEDEPDDDEMTDDCFII